MGVVNVLEEALSAIFQLPIVHNIGETKVEQAIGYEISDDKARTFPDSRQIHHVTVTVTMRSENGYDALGWMGQKMAAAPGSGAGWKLIQADGHEVVDYVTKGEILISTGLFLELVTYHDQVKEQIKSINIEASNG